MKSNISVVTCTMDRHDQLKKSIGEIKKLKNIEEQLIIDWNSKEELKKSFLDKNNKKIKIYRVKNEKKWWLTRAYNIGFYLSKGDYILKIDADVIIDFEKFNNLDYEKYDLVVFFDKPSDPGNFLIKKSLLRNINGFNEYMWEWGWSDNDLINRAKLFSTKIKYLDTSNFIKKIEHDNSSRTKVDVNKKYKDIKLFYYSLIKAYNDTNAFLAKKNLWSNKQKFNYIIKDNLIKVNHFYNLKDLNAITKIQYRFVFVNSFFKIYMQKFRFRKRLVTFLLFLLPEKILEKHFSLYLYPKNN